MIQETSDVPEYRQEKWNPLLKGFFFINASLRLLLQKSDPFDYDPQVAMPDSYVPNRQWLERAYDQTFEIEKLLHAGKKLLQSLRRG
jgi:hypothetical protein